MTSASKMWDVGSVVLGYVGLAASWRRPADEETQKRYGPMLVIHQSAETDEGVHTPAASITITGREGLLALRQAIDEALVKAKGGE